MIKYSSLKIWIKTIGLNGFYDVVGYYGDEITPISGTYIIDCNTRKPIIEQVSDNGYDYYYLNYDATNGFTEISIVDLPEEKIHKLQGSSPLPIYESNWTESTEDDILIPATDYTNTYPITANITLSDIDTRRCAYRPFILVIDPGEVYGIKKVKDIVDRSGLIDQTDTTLVLSQLNNDGIEVTPADGSNVTSLSSFTLVFHVTGTLNAETLGEVKLYSASSKTVKTTVASSNITLLEDSKTVQITLDTEVTTSGAYYLVLPLGFFNYTSWEKRSSSSLTMFLFRVYSEETNDQEYTCYPTVGSVLKEISIEFVNISSIYSLSKLEDIKVKLPSDESVTFSSGNCLSQAVKQNVVILRFYDSSGNQCTYSQSGTYTITIPANSIYIGKGYPLKEDITISYIVSGSTQGHELANGITLTFPGEGGSLGNKIIALIEVPKSYEGKNLLNPVVSYDVEKQSSLQLIYTDKLGNTTSSNIASVTSATPEKGENSTYFKYFINLGSAKNAPGNYTLKVIAGFFLVAYEYNGENVTNFNPLVTPTFYNKDTKDSVETDGNVKNFYNELIGIVSLSADYVDQVAFQINDTIYINSDLLSSIQTTPCLSLTTYDSTGAIEEISVVTEDGEAVNTQLKIDYTTSEGVTKICSTTLKYNQTYSILSLLPEETEYPQQMQFSYLFTCKGQTLEYSVDLQILSPAVYSIVNADNSAYRETEIDLYSGKTYVTRWGCLEITNDYDDILKVNLGTEEAPEIHNLAELIPTCRTRTGNLGGIYNETFGTKQPKGYGLYGENVYLTGNFYLNNGKSLVDISDNVLLAVGDTKKIKNALSTLTDSFKANINFIKNDQAALKAGLNATIKNYITTNKNSVLKIGLDYSLWALGNAGITLVNPNATYTYDKVTGNYNVDESTVGDGDEYVALQGNSIYFNINKTIKDKHAVVCTLIPPSRWKYKENGSIFVPYDNSSESFDKPVTFFLGYVSNLATSTLSNVSTKEFLKYVGLSKDITCPDSNNKKGIAIGRTPNGSEVNTQSYTFNPYYTNSRTSNSDSAILYKDSNGNYLNYYDLNPDVDAVYFVQKVDTVGLFDNTGKFNAELIQINSLLAIGSDYTLNQNFDQDAVISKDNYPILKNGEPDYTAPYVVISGKLGLLSANRANLAGDIKIGKYYADSGQYVLITDNEDEDARIDGDDNAALYFITRENGIETITSKFSGAINTNPLALLSPNDAFTIGTVSWGTTESNANFALYYYTLNKDVNEIERETPNVSNIGTLWTEHTGKPTSNYSAKCFYYKYNNTNHFSSEEALTSFTLDAGNQVSLKVNVSGKVSLSAPGNDPFNMQAEGHVRLIVKNANSELVGTIYIASVSCSRTTTYSTSLSKDANNKYQIEITKSSSGSVTKEQTFSTSKSVLVTNSSSQSQTYTIYKKLETYYNYYDNIDAHTWYSTNIYNSPFEQGDPYDKDGNVPNSYSVVSYWDPTKLAESVNVSTKVTGVSCTITPEFQMYTSRFLGNGILFGFNNNNYFTTYCRPANGESYSAYNQSNTVAVQYASKGYGQIYNDEGKYYELVAGKKMPKYFPILRGEVSCTTTENEYTFNGYAVTSPNEYCSTATYTQTDLKIKNYPFIDYNDTTATSYGSFKTSDLVYFTRNMDSGLYFIRTDPGEVMIAFDDAKWNTLLGAFCADINKLQIHLVGRGIWKDKKIASVSYATLKGVKSTNQPITATLEYATGGGAGTVDFSNFIRVDISDDASNNDGVFLIDISYCPN